MDLPGHQAALLNNRSAQQHKSLHPFRDCQVDEGFRDLKCIESGGRSNDVDRVDLVLGAGEGVFVCRGVGPVEEDVVVSGRDFAGGPGAENDALSRCFEALGECEADLACAAGDKGGHVSVKVVVGGAIEVGMLRYVSVA